MFTPPPQHLLRTTRVTDGAAQKWFEPIPRFSGIPRDPSDTLRTAKGEKLPAIEPLTGLRFFAAACVVQAHIVDIAVHKGMGDPSNPLLSYLIGAAALGMSMFFVLSGFVIHYNYREAILRGGSDGIWNFFVARFARLYPLYFLLVLFDLHLNGMLRRAFEGDIATVTALVQSLPQYLTLTQTWTFNVIGRNSLVYQMGAVSAVSWSISTEWFFYFGYPLICVATLWLPRAWLKLVAVILISVLIVKVLLLIFAAQPAINLFGVRNYGWPAGVEVSNQDSLFRWIVYFSPYSRIVEFFIGVLVCGAYLDVRGTPLNAFERVVGPALPLVAMASIVIVHWLMWLPTRPFPLLTEMHMCFGYALPSAALVWSVARYGGPLSRALEWKALIFLGETSYSIYLVHMLVVGDINTGLFAAMLSTTGTWAMPLHAMVIFLAVLATASLTYRLIEVPSRKWLREALSTQTTPHARDVQKPIGRALRTATCTVVVAVVAVVPLAMLVAQPTNARPPPLEGTIKVVESTYGAVCGAKPGNTTAKLAAACNDLKSCTYVVDVRQLGDPVNGCSKDFGVTWKCETDTEALSASIPAEAGLGGNSVTLSCP
jgi:peptidoglycan/LPS O-acetylase OafA/YrhL